MHSATSLDNTTDAEANCKICLIGVGDFSMDPTQRFLAQSEAQRKPWLPVWSSRRIESSREVRGLYVALAFAVMGPIAVLGVTVGLWNVVEGNLAGSGALLIIGAMFAGGLAIVTYWWLRARKFGKTVCDLETLPGVIGGWFKASVAVRLPVETPPTVLVRLENFRQLPRARITVWEISERVSPAQLTRIQSDRYLVPVRFRIPDRQDYYWKGEGGWLLKITAELPGIDLDASFWVPIFETDEAPPEEQTPEEGLWIVEVAYDAKWHNRGRDSMLIAKAGLENAFSGQRREGENDLGWYFKTEAEAQECADKFRGDTTLLRVRVYDEGHQ